MGGHGDRLKAPLVQEDYLVARIHQPQMVVIETSRPAEMLGTRNGATPQHRAPLGRQDDLFVRDHRPPTTVTTHAHNTPGENRKSPRHWPPVLAQWRGLRTIRPAPHGVKAVILRRQ